MMHDSTQYIAAGDGTRIAYRLEGKAGAPVILFANSIATTMHMWEGNIEDFVNDYQVLRYDLRGHGESDAPAGPYSIDRMGYDVIELLNALHIEKVYMVGLSLGGFIAQWLAIRAPERIEKLVLANTAAHLGPRAQYQDMITKAQFAPDTTFFADMFIHNWFPKKMLDASPSLIQAFRQDILAMDPQALASSFAVTRDFDARRTIRLITQPTLVLTGKYDKVTLPQLGEEIAATIMDAEVQTLPTVHLSNVERPTEFAHLVLGFLQK